MTDQAVTETNPESQTSGAETDAQDELDKLLSQYDQETQQESKPAQPAEPKVDPDQINEVVSYVSEERKRRAQEEIDTALSESTKLLKDAMGETGKHMPDLVAEGILHAEGRRNPKIIQAFENRSQNPENWQKIVQNLAKKTLEGMGATDKSSTESWAAVESAVHNASSSTSQESPPDFSSMSDAEFNAYKAKIAAQARRG